MLNTNLLPTPPKRRFAIGDIHGCFHTFRALVEETLNLEKEDQLFLLGDYIDRGPRSREVLDYILYLIESGYSLYPILGNHEQMFLQAHSCGEAFFVNYLNSYNSQDLLKGDLVRYLEFCRHLPYYYDTEGFYLSHTGFNVHKDERFPSKEIWQENTCILHGHWATPPYKIKATLAAGMKSICLDSGCVYTQEEGLGFLCALDMGRSELHFQENQEEK